MDVDRRLTPFLAGLAVAGCMRQKPPVEPSITIEYRDWDKSVSARPPAMTKYVPVGRTFTVTGDFHAVCEESAAPVFGTKDPEKYGNRYWACKSEETQTTVTCRGPCTVSGAEVTPTGPGMMAVTIELTSKNHHHVETREYEASVPDRIIIGPCLDSAERWKAVRQEPWPRCTLGSELRFGVTPQAGAYTRLEMAVTVQANGRALTGTAFNLRDLFDPTPAGVLPDGDYDVEIVAGPFHGKARLAVKVAPEANAPPYVHD